MRSLDDGFIKQLVDSGCKFFMLVEYTPVTAGTENWVLTEEQKAKVVPIRNAFRKKYPAHCSSPCRGTRTKSAAASALDEASCMLAQKETLNLALS